MDADTAGLVIPEAVLAGAAIIAGVWSQVRDPEVKKYEAAARAKEQLDPVPRTYLEHLLRRQMLVEAGGSDCSRESPDASYKSWGDPESLEIIRRQSPGGGW